MSVERWFEESREAVQYAFEEDADLFYKLLAATSPISALDDNVVKACTAYRQLKLDGGLQRSSFLLVHWGTRHKILSGKRCGRKVTAVYLNLAGNEDVVPVDRWMLRWFGYDPMHTYVNEQLYNDIEGRIRDEARALGITASRRQVQLWCQSRGSSRSYGDVIRDKVVHRQNLLRRMF